MKILWSSSAESTYKDEIAFIYKKWEEKEVNDFVALVDDYLKTLKSGVIKGKSAKKRDVKVSVVSKQTSLVYKISPDEINLLAFWNNKRNPKDLNKLLK